LASDLANVYGTEGQLAFQGQREQAQRRQDLLNSLIRGGSAIAGGLI
jgi:preprotein translocase subunit YajC